MSTKNNIVSISKRILQEVKDEMATKREWELKVLVKEALEELQEAKRTTKILEKKLNNLLWEIETGIR